MLKHSKRKNKTEKLKSWTTCTPALRRLRKKGHEPEASLDTTVKYVSTTKTQAKKKIIIWDFIETIKEN